MKPNQINPHMSIQGISKTIPIRLGELKIRDQSPKEEKKRNHENAQMHMHPLSQPSTFASRFARTTPSPPLSIPLPGSSSPRQARLEFGGSESDPLAWLATRRLGFSGGAAQDGATRIRRRQWPTKDGGGAAVARWQIWAARGRARRGVRGKERRESQSKIEEDSRYMCMCM